MMHPKGKQTGNDIWLLIQGYLDKGGLSRYFRFYTAK